MGLHDVEIEYKTVQEIGYMRKAALIVKLMHDQLREAAQPGVSLLELDQMCADIIAAKGAQSNFKGYYGYPATACISVNDTVVHGIPDGYQLQEGDIVSFDCGCYVIAEGKQWHGDSAFTMIVGDELKAPARAIELNQLTYKAMTAGIASLATGKSVACVGEAVEQIVAQAISDNGWEAGIVEEFIGHGIGTKMHMEPEVYNYRIRGRQPRLRAGMVLCIEPILTTGSPAVVTADDQWTSKTRDGSLAAHWESQVAITARGISVLNEKDWGASMLEPYGIRPVVLG
ncbi:MAG: type I methionyl aminopeptidase [Actinomycetaceae bacterium]|nr:type I methionyl aminopeptidase [Actinomycetaceae bacterium]